MNLSNLMRPGPLILLIVVLVLLFGAKRLPDAARSLGRSLRIIKAETKGLVDEPRSDDLDEKAEPRTGRQPLAKDPGAAGNGGSAEDGGASASGGEAATGEVIDPPRRVRDIS